MQQQAYSIVFCDHQMPVMTGPELVKRYRIWESLHRAQRQAIIAMSANAEPDDISASTLCSVWYGANNTHDNVTRAVRV